MTARSGLVDSSTRSKRPAIRLIGALCAVLALGLSACSSEKDASSATPADAKSDVQATSDAVETAPDADVDAAPVETQQIRVATFNASLFRNSDGGLRQALAGGQDAQARKVAEILQRVRPDIILLNEFDWDADGQSAESFAREYLAVGQNGADSLELPHRYIPTSNTGIASGVDLNKKDGVVTTPGSQAYGDDAFGFGQFPGQYGMLVLSRFPVQAQQARSFQQLKWREMPDNLQPVDWYLPEAVDVMRLSSKNHVDLPIDVDGARLHLLISHPTPPSFDGPEDRNGRRNHDEIRLWVDYISGGEQAAYLVDDEGQSGGLGEGSFVLLGDLNADPSDGDGHQEVVQKLLEHPRVQDPQPTSEGALEANERDGRANTNHTGDPALDTADFSDHSVGNLRVDYALPSSDLEVVGQGVFWPTRDAEHGALVRASDHHLVWVDLAIKKP